MCIRDRYKEGNWLQRKTVEYNAQDNSNSVDKIINFFDKNKKNLDFESGFRSNEPIFVLGLPRAGSTLLEQILASHSKIEGTQELGNIMTIGRRIRTFNNSNCCSVYLFVVASNIIFLQKGLLSVFSGGASGLSIY